MKKLYFLSVLLLAFQMALAQPSNDDCANSQNLILKTSTATIDFVISDAKVNNDIGCDGTAAADYVDIWYDFTMPFNGNVYINAKRDWNNMALYDACSGNQLDCGEGNAFFRGLSAGENYKLRLFRTAANADNNYLDFTIKAFEDATNNDCSGSENITVSETTTTIDFEIGGSTVTNSIGCDGTTAEDYVDIWYDFTMPFSGNVYINAKIGWNNIALYDACSGNQLDCGEGNTFFRGLSAGENYKLRLFRTAAEADKNYLDFTIKAFEDAANNDCSSSENITVSNTTTTIDFEIGGSTITNSVGCDGITAADYVDIWYDFTMPFNGNVYVNAKIGWNNIALYDACGGAEIECGSANQFFSGLSVGTNYKLRLFRTAADANNNYLDFTIKAFEDAANNDCSTSQNIEVSETTTTIDFEIGGSTTTNSVGCDGTTPEDLVDLWYDFTMPFNGNVFVNAKIGWNNIALYDACGGVQMECGSASKLFTELVAGENYKLRLFRTAADADKNYLDFTIIAYEEATNDDCSLSQNIAVSTTETVVDFNIGGASINNEVGCEGTTANDYVDIWYDFTMPVNGNVFVDASIGWNNIALYDACGGQQLQCGSANELFSGLTMGSNYKLRLYRTPTNANNNYTGFSIQAFEIINNDDCVSAENIAITGSPTTVNFGIAGANRNNGIGCSGTTAQDYADVWYEFTMPSDGDILIDGTIGWNNFALYDSCGGNEIACFEAQGDIIGLTNGTTYKLRVFRTSDLANNDGYRSFSIEIIYPLSTTDVELEQSIRVYPNPTASVISLSSINAIESIKVFNLLGKQVLDNKKESQVDLSAFTSGMYLLKVKTDRGEVTKKIIKI